MILFSKRAQVIVIVTLLLASAAPVAAESTNAVLDLRTLKQPFDPASAAGLPDAAKSAFAEASAGMKNGALIGFVFTASPDRKAWTLNVAPRMMTDYVASDSARQALEVCEFAAGQPCAILSVDGFEARPLEDWKLQPTMLFSHPTDFDSTVLPFASEAARAKAAEYLKATGPRAFALTTTGLWLWRGGANIVQAVDRAMADCATEFKNAPCLLYAVNERVVFVAR
jgi:hypothetical protein